MRTSNLLVVAASTLLSLVQLSGTIHAQTSIQDIGALPGSTTAIARAVSGDGSVVVGSSGPDTFRWTISGGMERLPAPAGFGGSFGLGVSADGRVVVGQAFDSFTSQTILHAFRWTASGGSIDLEILPGGSRNTLALDTDATGDVVVGISGSEAVRWTQAGGIQRLTSLTNGQGISIARGISDDGAVIVGSLNLSFLDPLQAFRWTVAGGIQFLGTLPGGDRSEALDVNADGTVICGSATIASGESRAFRWTAAGGMQDLGVLPGFVKFLATSLSADGSVISGIASGPNYGSEIAFRWTSATGMVPIGVLPGGSGAGRPRINADGSVLVGSLGTPSGSRSYRWESGTGAVGVVAGSPAALNSTGFPATIQAVGSSFLANNSIVLEAANLPLNTAGIFVTSQTQGNVPFAGGEGTLLLGGNIGRFQGAGQIQQSGMSGSFTMPLNLTSFPQPTGSVTPLVGQTWYFQAWFRDFNQVATSNFSSAVGVTFQ